MFCRCLWFYVVRTSAGAMRTPSERPFLRVGLREPAWNSWGPERPHKDKDLNVVYSRWYMKIGILLTMVSGILRVLGLRARMLDPSVCVVFGAPSSSCWFSTEMAGVDRGLLTPTLMWPALTLLIATVVRHLVFWYQNRATLQSRSGVLHPIILAREPAAPFLGEPADAPR